jgi:sugar phosphate isomerase/epimerase
MQRRQFVRSALGASLGAAVANSRRAVGAPRPGLSVGLELITVLQALDRDFRKTLMAVRAMGYAKVETLGSLGRSPSEVHAVLAECNLTSPSQHLVPDELFGVFQRWDKAQLTTVEALISLRRGYALQNVDYVVEQGIARAQAMHQQYLVWPVLFDEQLATTRDLEAVIQAFNRASMLCRQSGLHFAFHNGSKAFSTVGADTAYDLILRDTDPAVKMEFDTYYAAKAGVSAEAYFSRYPDRFRLVHLKDMDAAGKITDLGQGSIDFPTFLSAAERAGVRHFFVEHDQAQDPLASARTALRYLRGLQ